MDFFPALPVLFFLLAAVGVGVLAYLSYQQEKRRREELGALAQQLGWHYSSRRDHSHDDQYAHFEIFRRGHSRYAYNTLMGEVTTEGRSFPVKMGDFHYKVTSGTGKNRSTRTYNFSYVILHIPLQQFPDLLIRPEGMFDKLAGSFGFDDIDFESAEFSRQFYVTSNDKRFAYDVLHPQMMEFLLETQPPAIDLEQGRCCLSDGSRRWNPAEFREMLDWWQRFFQLWPRHVLRELEPSG